MTEAPRKTGELPSRALDGMDYCVCGNPSREAYTIGSLGFVDGKLCSVADGRCADCDKPIRPKTAE